MYSILNIKADFLFLVSAADSFWIAPEILRAYPLLKASQPGDVYGFAIILYEMCSRSEPYINETWYQSAEGELKRNLKGARYTWQTFSHFCQGRQLW